MHGLAAIGWNNKGKAIVWMSKMASTTTKAKLISRKLSKFERLPYSINKLKTKNIYHIINILLSCLCKCNHGNSTWLKIKYSRCRSRACCFCTRADVYRWLSCLWARGSFMLNTSIVWLVVREAPPPACPIWSNGYWVGCQWRSSALTIYLDGWVGNVSCVRMCTSSVGLVFELLGGANKTFMAAVIGLAEEREDGCQHGV